MSNREQLFEKYEDALFALLMDDLAEVEGERLLELNEELKADPDAAVPIDVQQRCIDVINREFAKKKRTVSRQRAKKVLKILPWAVVIATALMALAFAAFPSFRTGVLNVLKINVSEKTTWSFKNSNHTSNTTYDIPKLFLIELPEDFIIISQYYSSDFETEDYQSSLSPDSRFSVSLFIGQNSHIGINNEAYDYYKMVQIDGQNADFYSKGDNKWITWANPSIPYCVTIEATGVSDEIIIQIAHSFKYLYS